jgi:hypothetical protein
VRCLSAALVAYEDGMWREGATVALALVVALRGVPPALAAMRLKRCSVLGELPLAHVALAQAAAC